MRISRPEHDGANIWFNACNFKFYADKLKEEYGIELTWEVQGDRLVLFRECRDEWGNDIAEYSCTMTFPMDNWSGTLHDQAETLYFDVLRAPSDYNPKFVG